MPRIHGGAVNDRIQYKLISAILHLRCIFGSPGAGGTPGAIATKMRDAVSVTALHLCAKFQQNLFSSFRGDASQTDRQTDRQTDGQAAKSPTLPRGADNNTLHTLVVLVTNVRSLRVRTELR